MSIESTMLQSLRPLPKFLGYILCHFPLARVALLLTIVLSVLEYAVLSVMIPLAGVETVKPGQIVKVWSGIAGALNLPKTQITWLWFFLLLTALSVSLNYLHVMLSAWLSKQVQRHLSARIFHRVLFAEPMIQIYRRSIGYYVTLAGDDTVRAGTIINSASQTLAGGASALAGFGLLYLFSPRVFLAAWVFLAVCGAVLGWGFRAVLKADQRAVGLARDLGTSYIEALNGLRSIRSMASESFVQQGYSAGLRRYVRLLFLMDGSRHGMRALPALMLLLVAAVALWPGTALSSGLTVGYFFALTTIFIRIFLSLGLIVNHASTMLLDLRAAKDIDELIGQEEPPSVEPPRAEKIGKIALEKISFAYQEGKNLLSDFSFEFECGRTYAIVGRSGSGKSTLADILLGLLQPASGVVLVNGQAVVRASLHRRVVLVEQQARVFSSSVRENLLLGLTRADAELWDVLRAVDLEDYVRNLPHRLDTSFQYQGANLSGGQRQRLGIARALLREPDVIILDEATSALDAQTRHLLVLNLRARMRDGILIFITHERVIAEEADVLLELQNEAQ